MRRGGAEGPVQPNARMRRIRPDCLRIDNDGVARIGLCVAPCVLFGALSHLGELLQLSRNSVAILGFMGTFPTLNDWRNPVLPRSHDGSLLPNLAEYSSICATREVTEAGLVRGLEFRTAGGELFQKILFPSVTCDDAFDRFVDYHQGPLSSPAYCSLPNAASQARARSLRQGIPSLRDYHSKGGRDSLQLPSDFLERLIRTAAKTGIAFRIQLHSLPLIHQVTWLPEPLETNATPPHLNAFFGASASLHLDLEAIGGLWLWKGKCACCEAARWTIEVGDHADQISLIFSAKDQRNEEPWRELLTDNANQILARN